MEEEIKDQVSSSWNNMLDRLAGWLNSIITNLPNMILAILVFVLVYWLSRNLHHWVNKPLKRFVKQASVRELIANFVSIIVIAVGLFLALGILNLDTVLKSLLAVKDVLNIGDYIESNGYSGNVVEIGLRNTKIKESDNNIVVIPNSTVLENPFKNYALTERVRVTLKCGIAYDSDMEQVKEIAINSISERFPPNSEENIEFHYLEFGGSSIDFQMRFWVNAIKSLTRVEAHSEAMILLKKAFDKNDINIPFPITTLQIPDKPEIKLQTISKNENDNQENKE